jgi:hypothetical protein
MIFVLLINAFISLSDYRIFISICYTIINFLFIIYNSTYVHCSRFNVIKEFI